MHPTSADSPRNWTARDIAGAQRLLREGHTYADVGRVLGKTKSAVMSANHAFWRINWRDWRPAEEARAKKMLRRRCFYAEVVEVVGRSPTAVERKNGNGIYFAPSFRISFASIAD